MALADQQCVPCRGGVPPLESGAIQPLAQQVPAWQVVEDKKIRRDFQLPDFAAGLVLVNRIGVEAEAQGHHPDLYLAWGRVTVEIWTHKVSGLTESDFILAARIDRIASGEV
jgi:4a-hydroxytetrahydrobiopterin dehydratase